GRLDRGPVRGRGGDRRTRPGAARREPELPRPDRLGGARRGARGGRGVDSGRGSGVQAGADMSDLPAIRASDAEREQAVVRLRDASVEGRLTLEEFTARMTVAYEARTHDELAALVRDLPEHTAPVPARKPPA